MVLIAALALVGPAKAAPALDVEYREVDLRGVQISTQELAGMRLTSEESLLGIGLTGFGESLTVRTTNYTSRGIAVAGPQPDRGGDERSFEQAAIHAGSSAPQLDFLAINEGKATLSASTTAARVKPSEESRISETAYVDSSRPTLSASVAGAAMLETIDAGIVRVSGNFSLSFWSWNFTVNEKATEHPFVTGVQRSEAVGLAGLDATWIEHAQVAQLTVRNGWIEIRGPHGATLATFGHNAKIAGSGEAILRGVTGTIQTHPSVELENSELHASGEFTLNGDGQGLRLSELFGTLVADGVPIDLGESGPLRGNHLVASSDQPDWAWALGIVGIMATAILIKGPAQVSRFNRIQGRFDDHDYLGVLQRIEPFTRRRKFQRKATFLKAVSLLSLGEFREASLFLQTLGPREALEPATKHFLQACAAAGLAQDSVVIQHLSTCFEADPSYIEEARTVPALAGYLPYFSIGAPGEAAT